MYMLLRSPDLSYQSVTHRDVSITCDPETEINDLPDLSIVNFYSDTFDRGPRSIVTRNGHVKEFDQLAGQCRVGDSIGIALHVSAIRVSRIARNHTVARCTYA